ncbi:hypothetical protein Tco_0739495 [Tanacetum coccineum]
MLGFGVNQESPDLAGGPAGRCGGPMPNRDRRALTGNLRRASLPPSMDSLYYPSSFGSSERLTSLILLAPVSDLEAYYEGRLLDQIDIKVPLILERPFLSTARAKIDVYKRKITLRVGEEKIIFKSVKPASSIIKRVYMLSLRERMELDLEARLMGETLVLNRSLDPFLEDYIELNNLNEPLELRRNKGDDLMPTIKEGEVIKEFRTRNEDLDTGIDDYPSYCDDDKKIHIDCEPFLKEVGIKTKRLEGIITLYNGDVEVTYQMVRLHPRYQDRNALGFPIFYTGPREENIDEYWWRIYEYGNLEVLES